jgi:hypothetical protein
MRLGDKVIYTATTLNGDTADYESEVVAINTLDDGCILLDLVIPLPGDGQFEKRMDVKQGLPGEAGTWNLVQTNKGE